MANYDRNIDWLSSVCACVFMRVCVCVCVCVCAHMPICMSLCPFLGLSVCPSVRVNGKKETGKEKQEINNNLSVHPAIDK